MKYCNKCKVDVKGHLTYCPLCQNELITKDDLPDKDLFPDTYNTYTSQHLALKVLGFISASIIIICLFINLITHSKIWWSLAVVVCVGSVWLSVAAAIYKHRNILKYLLYQSIIICLLALFLDIFTGHLGWSVTFVLPIVFTLAMVIMLILSKVLHLESGDYIIYLLLDALFGIVPLIFLLTGRLITTIPSLICIITSLLSVTALIIFEGKAIYHELNRRLHI